MDNSDWQSSNNLQRCQGLPSPLCSLNTSHTHPNDAENSNHQQQQQQSSYTPQDTAVDGDTAHAIDDTQSPAPSLEELHHNNSLAGEAQGGRGGGYRPSRPTSTHQRPREHTATHDRPRTTQERQQVGSPGACPTPLLVLPPCGACLGVVMVMCRPPCFTILCFTGACCSTTWCFDIGFSSVLPTPKHPHHSLTMQDVVSYLQGNLPQGHLPLCVMEPTTDTMTF